MNAIKEKIGMAFGYTVKKTGEAVDSAKKGIGKSVIRAKINDKYTELGKIIYQGRSEGVDTSETAEAILSEIDSLMNELDAVDAE